MIKKLALYGGPKLIKKEAKIYNSIRKEELASAYDVVKSGTLSDFVGKAGQNFLGGKKVRVFEKNIEKFFSVKYAITVNSWTSGLIAAIGSIDIEPGDEVLLPTWTMSACAMAILNWNAIPVFVDIEDKTFNIDPDLIENKITKRTKAIIVVDIFGHPANYRKILKISKKYKLKVISDNAQSMGTKYFRRYSGTLCDVGGFSLNCHKLINTGEGGVLVTNNKKIAKKLRLIRNHAESSLTYKSKKDLINMIGYNFRLGEIESAIGIQQLKKLKKIILYRKILAKKLIIKLKNLKGLRLPIIKKQCSHSFYVFPLILDIKKINLSRELICKALLAEGVKIGFGYQNLHKLPIFTKKIAYGSKGFPWSINNKIKYDYTNQNFPVAEELHNKTFMHLPMYHYDYNENDIEAIGDAFQKVWSNLLKVKK